MALQEIQPSQDANGYIEPRPLQAEVADFSKHLAEWQDSTSNSVRRVTQSVGNIGAQASIHVYNIASA